MPVDVTMPKLSDTMEEGKILKWLKHPGERVTIGEIIAEVETDKANMELEAYDEGTLAEVRVREGESAPVGAVIAVLAIVMIAMQPYQEARLTAFLHPGSDTTGAGFQAIGKQVVVGLVERDGQQHRHAPGRGRGRRLVILQWREQALQADPAWEGVRPLAQPFAGNLGRSGEGSDPLTPNHSTSTMAD